MVVTAARSGTFFILMMHERTTLPFIMTEHAPHSPLPQPLGAGKEKVFPKHICQGGVGIGQHRPFHAVHIENLLDHAPSSLLIAMKRTVFALQGTASRFYSHHSTAWKHTRLFARLRSTRQPRPSILSRLNTIFR